MRRALEGSSRKPGAWTWFGKKSWVRCAQRAGHLLVLRQQSSRAHCRKWEGRRCRRRRILTARTQAGRVRLGDPGTKRRRGPGLPAGGHQQEVKRRGVWLQMLPRDGVVVWVLRPPASPSLGSSVQAPQVCSGWRGYLNSSMQDGAATGARGKEVWVKEELEVSSVEEGELYERSEEQECWENGKGGAPLLTL
ncbi:hypothetical protein NDU88_002558 [Pleurodeles waltl]|uniref:Uncharacterized protein n=1 Tax=Pleurodeles waltl TaxID=8319 RepID=A0AAV7T397_PLEWA|nr:hypothetical protein NDU88_002558 [Pleurodeles waltl]